MSRDETLKLKIRALSPSHRFVDLRRSGIGLLGLGLLFAVSACSLAGDLTPPPGARSVSVDTQPTVSAPAAEPLPLALPTIEPVDVNKVFPATRPSAAEGGAIFAEHCAECHGDTGRGDGPRSIQLMAERTEPLPDFSQPDLAQGTTPAAWFKTITEGRLDKFMPPWANKLSEAERWNVIAFLYTLSTPPEQMDSGEALYAAHCAACHGETGQGDGPEAKDQKLPDFTDLASMAKLGQTDLLSALSDATHSFDTLTETERRAVGDYVRAFSYDYAAPGAPAPEQIGAVRGLIVNGTGGGAVPAGLEVTLHGFDAAGGRFGLAATLTVTSQADGAFQFEAVPYKAGRQFLLTTQYGGVTYSSDVAAFEAGQAALEMPVHVYETTADASSLRVDRLHMFVDFASAEEVTIGQLYILSNLGDKTIAASDGGKTFELVLPPEAAGVAVRDETEGQDYFRTPNGLADTLPVAPGSGTAQFLVSYSLPYGSKFKFEQETLYPVDAANLLVSDVDVKLSGDGLTYEGQQEFEGSPFQSFTHQNLAAGDVLAFEMSGRPGSAAAPAGVVVGETTNLAVGIGAVALVLLGAGVWWYRRSQVDADVTMSKEELLQAVAELDDEFEAGNLDEREYEKERRRLKARLMKVWE